MSDTADTSTATETTSTDVAAPAGQPADDGRTAALAALAAARARPGPDDEDTSTEATTDATEGTTEAAPAAETGTSLKLRLRADRARATQEAQRDREVAAQERRSLETERQAVAQERQRFERLSKLAAEDPRAFIKETGLDLHKAVNLELEANHPDAIGRQALAEAQALRAELTREREQAAQETQKRQYQAAQENAEAEFVNTAKNEKSPYPLLRRMASKSPGATIQNAYLVAHQFKQEHGREPSMAEIAKGVESQLASIWGEEQSTKAETNKSRLSPQDQAKSAKTPKALDDMTAEERKQHAVSELRRIRAKQAKEAQDD